VSPTPSASSENDAVAKRPCHVVTSDGCEPQPRDVVEERPVRIVVNGSPIATLMRTPGSEMELALGFLLTEGIIRSRPEVNAISFCRDGAMGEPGEILVLLADPDAILARGYRDVMSSCSLCGDAWMDSFAEGIAPFDLPKGRLCVADVFGLASAMSRGQGLFERTGATHAAALAERPVKDAERLIVRQDIGRHNALDKAVGAALDAGLDLSRSLLMLSSRLSFEMVTKAARAGIANVGGVSAPSASAIRLAERLNMFLAGFVRGETMTVYCGIEALTGETVERS